MSMPESRPLHIAIIGSGSGAFAAATRAVESGARVTLIEESETLGGTCVNTGCVPSKIALRAAQLAQQQRAHPFDGLAKHEAVIDRERIRAQQAARVAELRQVKYQAVLDGNASITLRRGRASFQEARSLRIDKPDGTAESLCADRVLIATGARAAIPAIPGLAETPFWTSEEAVFAGQTPAHLLIVGAGFVALEQAQAFARLGSRVTVLARGAVLSRMDPELGAGLAAALREEGIRVLEKLRVEGIEHDAEGFTVRTASESLKGDRLLVATGRTPHTGGLGLERAGVATDARGAIQVDDRLRTSAAGIYATGDCTDLPQLVYVAAAGGTRAAINMTGGEARLHLSAVPAVIFTDPQVATVGLDEAHARALGISVDTRRLDFEHLPRALANFDTRGFVRLVAEAGTHRLLGVQILGEQAGEMIQTAALAVHHRMTVEALADMLFPYLVHVEALKLCAQSFARDVSKLSCCAG
jgi:mercuric reductase